MTDALTDAAKMVTKLTRASPIISAAAVEAVRRGLRIAFSRASLPGWPAQRANGQPSSRASGRATSGLSTPTPRKITTAPPATLASRLPCLANSPASSSPTPATVISVPSTVRRRPERAGAATASSCSAATVGVADPDPAAGDPVQAGQAVHQGGLAGAARPHDRGEAPAGVLLLRRADTRAARAGRAGAGPLMTSPGWCGPAGRLPGCCARARCWRPARSASSSCARHW